MNDRTQKHYSSVLIFLGIIGGLTLVSDGGFVPIADAQDDVLVYVPVSSPCRVLRTQGTGQTHLNAGAPREFFSFGPAGTISAQGGNAAGCDHPRSAVGVLPTAIAANVTAVGNQASGNGNIVAYPAGGAVPGASTVNYTTTANIANSTLITLRALDGKFTLLSSFSNVPALVDVIGYYYPIDAEQQVTVTCPAESIQAAIDAAPPTGRLIITIDGTCNENVLITRDHVTLVGGAAGGIEGQIAGSTAIKIVAARHVVIDDLTITSKSGIDGDGIEAHQNADVAITDSTLTGHQFGVWVTRGAYANLVNNVISRTSATFPASGGTYGLILTEAAVADVTDTSITINQIDNGNEGAIGVFRQSDLRMFDGNTLTNQAVGGVVLNVVHNAHIRANSGHTTLQGDIIAALYSIVDLRDVDITGNVRVGPQGNFRMRNEGALSNDVDLTGNVETIDLLSIAQFRDNVRIAGTVDCSAGGFKTGNPMFISGGFIGGC